MIIRWKQLILIAVILSTLLVVTYYVYEKAQRRLFEGYSWNDFTRDIEGTADQAKSAAEQAYDKAKQAFDSLSSDTVRKIRDFLNNVNDLFGKVSTVPGSISSLTSQLNPSGWIQPTLTKYQSLVGLTNSLKTSIQGVPALITGPLSQVSLSSLMPMPNSAMSFSANTMFDASKVLQTVQDSLQKQQIDINQARALNRMLTSASTTDPSGNAIISGSSIDRVMKQAVNESVLPPDVAMDLLALMQGAFFPSPLPSIDTSLNALIIPAFNTDWTTAATKVLSDTSSNITGQLAKLQGSTAEAKAALSAGLDAQKQAITNRQLDAAAAFAQQQNSLNALQQQLQAQQTVLTQQNITNYQNQLQDLTKQLQDAKAQGQTNQVAVLTTQLNTVQTQLTQLQAQAQTTSSSTPSNPFSLSLNPVDASGIYTLTAQQQAAITAPISASAAARKAKTAQNVAASQQALVAQDQLMKTAVAKQTPLQLQQQQITQQLDLVNQQITTLQNFMNAPGNTQSQLAAYNAKLQPLLDQQANLKTQLAASQLQSSNLLLFGL